MLKEIEIKNYKSIKESLLFSMEADVDRVSEYKEHVVNIGSEKLLKVSSMYGPNGGGKSNILKAIELPLLLLNGENGFLINSDIYESIFSDNNIIEESIFFVNGTFELGYSFRIVPTYINAPTIKGVEKKVVFNIIEENVSYRKINEEDFKVLLNRNSNGKIISTSLENIGIPLKINIGNNISSIKYLFVNYVNKESTNNVELLAIRDLFYEISSIRFLDNMFYFNDMIKIIEAKKDKLIELLNNVDINIKDILIKKDNTIDPIYFVREVSVNGQVLKKEISFNLESKGTQKIFILLINILESLNYRTIFLADDLNAYLHPKLYKSIIDLFNSKENLTSQLIFNSHDLLNMNNKVFRRDEIWFVYRNENYSTIALPLSNIVNYKGEQIRKDATYYKQYLEGRYGADPFIRKGLNWNDVD